MAGIPFRKLVDMFCDALERAGAAVIREMLRDDVRPASIRVTTHEAVTDCRLFLWTITTGGGKGVRPESERRIQLTNVLGFPLLPGIRTLIGGWSPEFEVFAFWDARRHTRFSSRSPSLQVSANTLESASANGIGTYLRPTTSGLEVVASVNLDSLLWYIQHGAPLHNSGQECNNVADLVHADSEVEREYLDTSRDEDEASRRYDLVEMMRAYRDSKFRPEVLRAYRHRCAVCGYALKLVEAAHIVPVSHAQSSDCVTNGIALCRLHHGAYDGGLLGIRPDNRIIVNPDSERRLADLKLDMGLDDFKRRLPENITVPPEREVRPTPENLRLGMLARSWPRDFLS